jgi:curved DNA-binding protein CbpA
MHNHLKKNVYRILNYYYMDPYKILKVEKHCSIGQLRAAFKKVAIKVHPDKGGNEELFNIVVESYIVIYKKIKSESGDKDFNELKSDSRNQFQNLKKTKHVSFEVDQNDDEFSTKFNKIFDDNKFHDPTDDGYGQFMSQSSKEREELDISKSVKNFKDFNSAFDDQEAMNKEIIMYKEPEPLTMSKSLAFNELGVDKVDDFSSDTTNSRNIGYCDYMKAHTTNKLVDKRYIKETQSYKNMDDIEKSRSTQRFELSSEDRKKIDDGLKKDKEREINRQLNLQNYDKNVNEHFVKVNKLMINQRQ